MKKCNANESKNSVQGLDSGANHIKIIRLNYDPKFFDSFNTSNKNNFGSSLIGVTH
jgi:hypothetical protein